MHRERDEEADAIVAQAGSIGPEREAEIRKLVRRVRERAAGLAWLEKTVREQVTTGAGVAPQEHAVSSLSDERGDATPAPVASTTAAARASDLASGSEAGKPPQPFSSPARSAVDWKAIEAGASAKIGPGYDALLELRARLAKLEQAQVGIPACVNEHPNGAKLEQAGAGATVERAPDAEKAPRCATPASPQWPGIAQAPEGTQPCGYCHNENLCVEIHTEKYPGMTGFAVRCGSAYCGARGPVRPNQGDAVDEWNKVHDWYAVNPKPKPDPTPASPACPECGHALISHGAHHGCVAPSGIWNRPCRCTLTRSEVEARAAKNNVPVTGDGTSTPIVDVARKGAVGAAGSSPARDTISAARYRGLCANRVCMVLAKDGPYCAGWVCQLEMGAAKASEPAPTPQPIERGVVANEGSFIRGIIPSPTPSEVPSWVPSADELRSLANRHAPFGISDSVFDEIRRLIASRSPSPSFSATREACARVCEKEAEKWSLGDADSETADCVNWLARRIRALREEDCK